MGRQHARTQRAPHALTVYARARDPQAPGAADAARRFVRWHANKVVARGLIPALADMTLDARLQAIDVAAETAIIDEPVRFDIRDAGHDATTFAFDVTYADEHDNTVTVRQWVAETRGGWKIDVLRRLA